MALCAPMLKELLLHALPLKGKGGAELPPNRAEIRSAAFLMGSEAR